MWRARLRYDRLVVLWVGARAVEELLEAARRDPEVSRDALARASADVDRIDVLMILACNPPPLLSALAAVCVFALTGPSWRAGAAAVALVLAGTFGSFAAICQAGRRRQLRHLRVALRGEAARLLNLGHGGASTAVSSSFVDRARASRA